MSDEELHARTGRLLAEYKAVKETVGELARDLQHHSVRFAALGKNIAIRDAIPGNMIVGASDASMILSELEHFSAADLRDTMARYQEAAARLIALRNELKSYGMD